MKLLCVTPSYWPNFKFGGIIFSIHAINKILVKRGINVTVYTTTAGSSSVEPVSRISEVDGVRVFYFHYIRFFDFLGQTGYQLSLEMKKYLRNNLGSFDIVHTNSIWNFTSAIVYFYCRKTGKPYVISPRGSLYPYTMHQKFWKKVPYYFLLARNILRCASAVHYTSENEKEECHRLLNLKNRAFIVPNGVDLSSFSVLPGKEILKERFCELKGKKVIIFLSRLHRNKGLDILIEAFDIIAKEYDNVHLVIAGRDDGDGYEEVVRRSVKAYSLDLRVSFVGMLAGKEKLEAFAGSDIFVLPSYSESFGMACVEAMACGVAVIISDKVGIHKEVMKNNAGIVVEPKIDSLYKGIKSLLENDSLRDKIGLNGRKFTEKYYNIEKAADMMIREYQEVLR